MKRNNNKLLAILLFMAAIAMGAGGSASAAPYGVGGLHPADSVEAAHGRETEADSLASAIDSLAVLDSVPVSVPKVRDKGYDASRYSMMKRYRPKSQTFVSGKFMDNTFLSVNARSMKLATADYSFGMLGGLSFGKLFNPFCTVRISAAAGAWTDNFNGRRIAAIEVGADYLFNIVSYLDGYRPDRICELSLVAGLGYAFAGYKGHWGHAFTCHAGLNLSMRLLPGVNFFLEPKAAIYSNGMALSYAGNWRAWLAAFQGDFGISISNPERKGQLNTPWFVSLSGGTRIQNSMIVRNDLGISKSCGMDYSLSAGRYFNRFSSIRASLSYGRSKWVVYNGNLPYFTDYYSLGFDLLLDFVSMVSGRDDNLVAASILFGPEIGFMHKADIGNDINRAYMGLFGGVQLKFRVWRGISVFLEPGFRLIPYSAGAVNKATVNDCYNYYDGLLCLDLGVEYRF